MFGWLFPKRTAKIDQRREDERDRLGLTILKESILTRQLSNEVQQTLAHGALMRLHNDS